MQPIVCTLNVMERVNLHMPTLKHYITHVCKVLLWFIAALWIVV